MLHWLNRKNYDIAEKLGQFRFLQEKKEQGYAKRTGFSYHDSAALLDEILTTHPEVEVCLSGMNTEEQVIANTKPFTPLTAEEVQTLFQVRDLIEQNTKVPC